MARRRGVGRGGMAWATLVVGVAAGVGLGKVWMAALAAVCAGVVLAFASGTITPRMLISVWRWVARRVGPVVRAQWKRYTAAQAKAAKTRPRAWEQLAREHEHEGGIAIVEVSRAAILLGIEPRTRLTPTQSAALANEADAAGFAIEPDARGESRTYAWDQMVALYRERRGTGPTRDPNYRGAALIYRLGLYIAASDGIIDRGEVDHIARFLEEHFRLDPAAVRRLEALKVLLGKVPPSSLAGLGKELQERLGVEDRAKVGPILVGVAAADGVVAKKEVVALRAAYRSLGIDPAALDALLEKVRTQAPPAPEARPAASPPAPAATPAEGSVAIDPERLRRVLGETQDVARILGEAMRDGEEEGVSHPLPKVVAPPSPAVKGDPRFEGLDPRYRPMLGELLGRPTWPRGDFEAMARRHGLMPSSVEEVINEWSQDKLGDFLLEPDGGDPEGLRVQISLLSKLTVSP